MRRDTLIKYCFVLLIVSAVGSCTNDPRQTMTDNKEKKATAIATFAGGCFWCVEAAFEKYDEIDDVISGYTGGRVKNPTYKQVSSGSTDHVEAVEVHFDPGKITYDELLEIFWRCINPTDPGGQFADRGHHYTTAIFYHDRAQKESAENSRKQLDSSGKFSRPVETKILPAGTFYKAEEYHQDYHLKNPTQYQRYFEGSGRADYIRKTWGDSKSKVENSYIKPSKEEIKMKLNDLQYRVTQENGTEPPFNNEYWNNKKPGIYVDIVSGEPLFASVHKYTSGTGWPSFFQPLEKENIIEKKDMTLGMARIEVRSKHGDSHLGHVFPDGPQPTGLRYCINSASLRFIPKNKLLEEGYDMYTDLFQ